MDTRKKKNAIFIIGFITGFAAGIIIHHHALGAAFGVMLGLAMREIYDYR